MKRFNIQKALLAMGLTKAEIQHFVAKEGRECLLLPPPTPTGIPVWGTGQWLLHKSSGEDRMNGFQGFILVKGSYRGYPFRLYYDKKGRVGMTGLNMTNTYVYQRDATPEEFVKHVQAENGYKTKTVPMLMMEMLMAHRL